MQSPRLLWKILGSLMAMTLLVGTAGAAGVARLEIVGLDDWPADSILDLGDLRCAGGEVNWDDPVTPVCEQSGQLKFRGTMAYGCESAATPAGVPVPEFNGVALFTLNGNLDATYSGPVWGTWMVVPAATCDPSLLVDPEVYWKGKWRGKRTRMCDGPMCRWVGALELVGRGYGEGLAGQHFKGTETILTFTPLPLPYELLGICTPPACPPEGIITGTIKK